MKKSISVLLLITLLTLLFTLGNNNEVKALDFASDYFTVEDVEITPNKTIPVNLGLTDYRYGMLLSSSKSNIFVSMVILPLLFTVGLSPILVSAL